MIEARIEQLLAVGVGDIPRESLSELAWLGARLVIQRAVRDEFDAWLGRARDERRLGYQRGLRNCDSGLRNGFVRARCGRWRASCGSRSRGSARRPSRSSPSCFRAARGCCAEPLRAIVIGAFVRGLLMREIESLCEKAGLGMLSRRPRRAFARSCASALRRSGAAASTTFRWRRCFWMRSFWWSVRAPGEGVLVAWGFIERGERVLLAVMLGMREAHEDWI